MANIVLSVHKWARNPFTYKIIIDKYSLTPLKAFHNLSTELQLVNAEREIDLSFHLFKTIYSQVQVYIGQSLASWSHSCDKPEFRYLSY